MGRWFSPKARFTCQIQMQPRSHEVTKIHEAIARYCSFSWSFVPSWLRGCIGQWRQSIVDQGPRNYETAEVHRSKNLELDSAWLTAQSSLRVLSVIFVVAFSGFLAGCTGRARIEVVPFTRTDLSFQEPLVQHVAADQAYADVDEQGLLTVSIRRQHRSLLSNALDTDWMMSIVVEGLPAGRERLCRLNGRSVRIAESAGTCQRRGRAVSGVVVLQAPQAGVLHGRFHITAHLQQFSMLSGWSPEYRSPMVVVVGEFDAVFDRQACRSIREATEADGFERFTPSTQTEPASPE